MVTSPFEVGVERAAASLPPELVREFHLLARQFDSQRARWGLYLLQYEHLDELRRLSKAISSSFGNVPAVRANNDLHADWLALEAEIERAASGADAIQVFGLDDWLDVHRLGDAVASRLRAWNVRRDGFAKAVSVPVLCWMRQVTLGRLAQAAPDLWSWRSGVHRFVSELQDHAPRGPHTLLTPLAGPIDNRSLPQRMQRMGEIRQFLDAPANDSIEALRLRSALLEELASLHASIGQLEEAQQVRIAEQIPVLELLGDRRIQVAAQMRLAEILQDRGDLDAAMALLESQIPVLDTLGDARAKAVARGQIADILQDRGQLDEALHIRLDEELPVYEQLGDAREQAVTHGQIADILQATGQLDEALLVRTKRELPIVERLGDVRGAAIIRTRIADILVAQSRLDDALQLLRQQVSTFETLGDIRSTGMTLGRIADILGRRGQIDEALSLLAQKLRIAESMGDLESIAHAKASIAWLRLAGPNRQPKTLEAARQDLSDAFAISRKLGRADFVAYVGLSLAEILLEQGRNTESAAILDQTQPAIDRSLEMKRLLDQRDRLLERLNAS